jgi:hypothetical protein
MGIAKRGEANTECQVILYYFLVLFSYETFGFSRKLSIVLQENCSIEWWSFVDAFCMIFQEYRKVILFNIPVSFCYQIFSIACHVLAFYIRGCL